MEELWTLGSQTSGLDGGVTSAQALVRMEGIEGKRNRGRLETKPRGEGAGMRYEQERGDSQREKKGAAIKTPSTSGMRLGKLQPNGFTTSKQERQEKQTECERKTEE